MENGQLAGDVGRVDDGAEILLAVGGIREQRPAREVGVHVRRGDEVTDHLAIRGKILRNDRAVQAVARCAIAMHAVVEHGRRHLVAEHDAVTHRDAADGPEGRKDARRHEQVLAIQRHVGEMRHGLNHGTGHRSSAEIDCAGRGRGEIDSGADGVFRRRPGLREAVRYVWNLLRKHRAELAGDGGAVGLDEREVFAARGEREARVQPRSGDAPVVAGCKHDEESAAGQVGRREAPFGQVAVVVGE